MGRKTIFKETIKAHAERLGRSIRSVRMPRRVLERRRAGQDNHQILQEMGESNCPQYLLDLSVEELEKDLGVKWVDDRYVPGEYTGRAAGIDIPGVISPLFAGDSSKESIAQAGYTPSRPPFGYRKTHKKRVLIDEELRDVRVVVSVPEEASLVREVFSQYLDGHTMSDIASMLNSNPGWPRTRTGGDWTKDSIREMLGNPYYSGYVLYRGTDNRHAKDRRRTGTLHLGHHEALISWDDFERVQQMRRKGWKSWKIEQ